MINYTPFRDANRQENNGRKACWGIVTTMDDHVKLVFQTVEVFFSLVLGGNSLKSKLNMLYSCEDTWQGPQIWPLWNHFVGPSNIHSRHLDFSVTTEAYHTNSWEK